MNRILQYMGRACPCCSAREYVAECRDVAANLESKADGLFEFSVPTATMVTEDGRRGIALFICYESDRIALDNAATDVANELRELADRLWLAADAIGGAV